MIDDRPGFLIGAPVYTADGKALGKVVSATARSVVVERGWLIRRGYSFRHADVDRYQDGAVVLRLLAEQVDERFGS